MLSRWLGVPLCICCIGARSMKGEIRVEMRDGRPLVNDVFVNGHGPYRFLVDTGSNVNLIEKRVAEAIGITAIVQAHVTSAVGNSWLPVSAGNEIRLGPVKAGGQELLVSPLKEVRSIVPGIQGVLGQGFLARFDYMLDVCGGHLAFGQRDVKGTRSRWRMLNGRMAVLTSLGEMVLDSGVRDLVRFGVAPDRTGMMYARTATGGRFAGSVSSSLAIEGRNVWTGDAVTIPAPDEFGVAGLIPLGLFKAVYVSNSEKYLVFE